MQIVLPNEKLLPAEELKEQIQKAGIEFKEELRFYDQRQWRFDFAFPEKKLAVEVEGGIHLSGRRQGRHTRGAGFEDDCQKYNVATILGWRVMRVTPGQIQAGLAMTWILLALNAEHPEMPDTSIPAAKPRKAKRQAKRRGDTVVIRGRSLKIKAVA